MRQLDPFVRSCFLTVVVAALPVLLLALLVSKDGSTRTYTYAAFGYAVILSATLLAYAKKSEVWRMPLAINIPFFVFVGFATMTL